MLKTYGYPLLFIGCVVEGETAVLIAGALAFAGLMHLPTVILVSFLGAVCGDHLFFAFGRLCHPPLSSVPDRWRTSVDRARKWISRYHYWIIFGFRFCYGTRAVIPMVLGATQTGLVRFCTLNIASAALWAVATAGTGYLLFERVAAHPYRFHLLLFVVPAVIVTLAVIRMHRRSA